MFNTMNPTQLSTLSKAFQTTSILQGGAETLFDAGLTKSAAWFDFADSWNDLHEDQYMADGGKYRFRRYSEFRVDMATRSLTALPHVAYRQSKEDNYLNGGIDRMYSPIKSEIQSNLAFSAALFRCADVIDPMHPGAQWLVQVFQNRVFANLGELGKPTPEGVHRDGVDYVLTLMMNRYNVDGGESATYEADGRTVTSTVTLQTPGDYILLNDNATKHSVQPIVRRDVSEPGYRDALIAMFTLLPQASATTPSTMQTMQ